MRITAYQLKPVALLIAIVIGLSLNCTRAYAGKTETIVVAGGCFWCVESDFESAPGAINAESGYNGRNHQKPDL